jgi:hypothetical protein
VSDDKSTSKKTAPLRMAANAGARMRALMGAQPEAEPVEPPGEGEQLVARAESGEGAAASGSPPLSSAAAMKPTVVGTAEGTLEATDVPTGVPTSVSSDVTTDVASDVSTGVSTMVAPDVRANAGTGVRPLQPQEGPVDPPPKRARQPSPRIVGTSAASYGGTKVRDDVPSDVRTLQTTGEDEYERRRLQAIERWKDEDVTVVAVRVPAALNAYMDRYVNRINERDPKKRYRKQDAVLEAFAAFFADHPMPPAADEEI